MTAQDNATITRRMYDAFNAKNLDGALAVATDDIELVLVPFSQTFTGKAGFSDFMGAFLSAFPDLTIRLTNQIANDDYVVNEFTACGVHNGPLQTPAGPIPASGKTVDFTVCEVIKMRDGKVAKLTNYQDAASILRQVGAA
jgi:steroid delta-isomerase-like uncharacterized protein